MRTRPALTRSIVVTRSIVAATALAATLTLSGCADDSADGQPGGGDAEGTQQPAAEAPEEPAEDDPATERQDDGPATTTLPDDFPTEVPVIDGAILMGQGMDVDGTRTWMASIGVDDSEAAIDLAREQLLAAGFEETGWTDASAMRLGSFTTDRYQVMISNSHDSETGDIVGYQVVRLEAGA